MLVLTLLTLTILWFTATEPSDPASPSTTPPATQQTIPIQASLTEQAINQLIDQQLVAKPSSVLRSAELTFQNPLVRIDNKLTFLGRDADVVLTYRPEIQPNGDLRLHAETATIGGLRLPQRTLYTILRGLALPDWVHVHTDSPGLDLRLSERAPSTGYSIQIKSINWSAKTLALDIGLRNQ